MFAGRIQGPSRARWISLSRFWIVLWVGVAGAHGQPSQDEDHHLRDVSAFGAFAHRSLDEDCDGTLALDSLGGALRLSLEEPREAEELKLYDGNNDGVATATEIAAGIRAAASQQVDNALLVDANDDGALSLREHALGFPDRLGTPGENGLTPRQIQSFRFLDRDGNDRVTRKELFERHETTFLLMFWSKLLAHHLERMDSNDDGSVQIDELARGLGHDSPERLTAEQRTWYDELATVRGSSRAIDLVLFRIRLLRDSPVDARIALERPIRSVLVPDCSP